MFVCGACGQRYDRGGFCAADGQPLVASTDPMLGTEVGRYRLTRLLGEGGMGQVYLGVQPAIGSRVAIKILNSECTRNPELLERFFAEARSVNVINHENIVSVIDLAQLADGRPYIIMEYIEGHTLRALVREGTAPLGGIVQVATEMLSALGAAHARGIVHRDLKPDNVIITAEGHAKVLDFGIAKLAPGMSNANSPRTKTGALLGTPAYMAPEQISGAGNVDPRTDLYAAGVVLFEAVTGRTPFQGDTLFDLMRAHLEQAPPSPRALRPELPVAFEQVILRALAKEPADRFQTAGAMAQALHHAARELAPDQWRVLSTRGGMVTGRPSLEAMAHSTPREPGHVSTVRSVTPVPEPRAEVRTERDRPRRRGMWIALAAAAASIAGVGMIVLGQGEGAAPAPAAPAAGSDVTAAAPTTASPAASPAAPLPAPGPSGPPAAPAQAPTTAPARPPAPGAPAVTAPRKVSPAPAVTPSSPTVAIPGPTIVGGGSAADHGVHIGPGVQVGPGVQIGGGSPASPPGGVPKPFTRTPDYDPKKFDGAAYAAKALALARTIYPDAGLVSFEVQNVYPSGLANLAINNEDAEYLFRSPARSARPPGLPRNVEVEIPCYVEVTAGVRAIEVRARDHSGDPNCKARLRTLPPCTFAQVWARAKGDGARTDTIAKVSFLTDGSWWFDNQDGEGEGLATSYQGCR